MKKTLRDIEHGLNEYMLKIVEDIVEDHEISRLDMKAGDVNEKKLLFPFMSMYPHYEFLLDEYNMLKRCVENKKLYECKKYSY